MLKSHPAWERPPFWVTKPKEHDRDKFVRLARLKSQLIAADPDTRRWSTIYKEIERLERALKLTPTRGGFRMKGGADDTTGQLCVTCGNQMQEHQEDYSARGIARAEARKEKGFCACARS